MSTEQKVGTTIGIGTLFLIVVSVVWPSAQIFIFFMIGVSQLVYVIPLTIILWKDHRRAALLLIAAASVVFLLNSLCWGFFLEFL